MNNRPITFLFSDVENSTALWENYPLQMRSVFPRYHEILRGAIETHGDRLFETVGYACRAAAFATASEALRAALEVQRGLFAKEWSEPINLGIKMALHTGAVEERGGDYFGPAVNRIARLISAGHGGQNLLSGVTYGLVRDDLELRDLRYTEHVFPDRTKDSRCS